MNNVQLLGRLTKDVEIEQSKSKKIFARFTLAVSRGKEETDFIDCVAFDKLSETISKYVKKGERLLVQGSLNVSNYEDKDGNKRKSVNVFVSNITFIETAKKENEQVTTDDLPY